MEENKELKISLSTAFLIIAIVIIIIMGIYIYKLYNDKLVYIEKVSNLNNQINSLQNEKTSLNNQLSNNNSVEYKITGRYNQENAQGDEPAYTFSENNKVTYGALWMCSGTYTLNKNTIKIKFSSAVDPDGNKANIKDFDVDETVELTIINDDTLKDNSDGVVYSK